MALQWVLNKLFFFRRNRHIIVFSDFFLMPVQLGSFLVHPRSFRNGIPSEGDFHVLKEGVHALSKVCGRVGNAIGSRFSSEDHEAVGDEVLCHYIVFYHEGCYVSTLDHSPDGSSHGKSLFDI